MADKKIRYEITADPAGFKKGFEQAAASANSLDMAVGKIGKSVIALGSTYLGAQGIGAIIKTADSYALLESKLKLVSKGSEEFSKNYNELFKISQNTGSNFEQNARNFSNLSLAIRDTNISSKESLQIFDAVNKSLVVAGASTEEASSFMLQFRQALGSGVLQGEEFRAMMESNSYFGGLLAKALDTDVAGLRAMSKEGKLTTDTIRQAFPEMAAQIDSDFNKIQKTVARSMIELQNAFGDVLNHANQSEQGTNKLATAISGLAGAITDNKETISNVFAGIINGAEVAVTALAKLADYGGRDIVTLTGLLVAAKAAQIALNLEVAKNPYIASAAALATLNELLKAFDMNIGTLPVKVNDLNTSLKNLSDVWFGKRDWNTGEIIPEIDQIEKKITYLKGTLTDKPWQLFPDAAEDRRHAKEVAGSLDELAATRLKIISTSGAYVDTWQRGAAAERESLENVSKFKDSWQTLGELRLSMAKEVADAEGKAFAEADKEAEKAAEKLRTDRAKLQADITRDMAENAEKQAGLVTWVDGITHQTITSQLERKLVLHNQEYEAARKTAAGNIELMQQVETWHISTIKRLQTYDEMYSDSAKKSLDGIKDSWMVLEELKVSTAEDTAERTQKAMAEMSGFVKGYKLTEVEAWKDATDKEIAEFERLSDESAEYADTLNTYKLTKHKEYLDRLQKEEKRNLTEMEKAWGDFGRDVKSDFTSFVGDSLRGEFNSIGEAWDSLTDRLLNSFIDMIADMVVAWATSELFNLFGFGGGSFFGYSGSIGGGSGINIGSGGGNGMVSGIASYFASDAGAAAAARDSTNLSLGDATPAIVNAAANSAPGTASSLVTTAGGVIGVAGGAYGMYSGINSLKEGNYAAGTVQTALGGYSTYQGAVTLGLIEKGTATAAYDATSTAISSYFSGSATTATTAEVGAAMGTAAAEAFATNAAADAAGTYAASITAAEFGTSGAVATGAAAEGSMAAAGGTMAASAGPAAIVAMLAMWAAMDIADQGRNKTRDKLNEARISPTGFGMVGGVGTDGELTRLSEEARDSIYLLNNAFGEIDAVSIDAASGVMVLADNIIGENGLITGINYGIETFDNASGAWVRSQASFSDLLDKMEAHIDVTGQSIAATAEYVATAAGVPTVADELVIAFTELQTGIFGVAGAAMTGAGTFANAVAMMQGAAGAGINWSGGNNIPWEDQSNPDVRGSDAWVAAGGGSAPIIDDGYGANYLPDTFGMATGGIHRGGWRLVGERGPELEYTPPSRIFTNTDTQSIIGQSGKTAQAIADLREVVIGAIMASSEKMRRIENTVMRWEKIGLPAARA